MPWKMDLKNIAQPNIPTRIWTQEQLTALNYFLKHKQQYKNALEQTARRLFFTDNYQLLSKVQLGTQERVKVLWAVFYSTEAKLDYFILHCRTALSDPLHLICSIDKKHPGNFTLLFKVEDWINHQIPEWKKQNLPEIQRKKGSYLKKIVQELKCLKEAFKGKFKNLDYFYLSDI